MMMEAILFYSIALFIIIFLAVRLAIQPLIKSTNAVAVNEESELSLVKLQAIGVLDNDELEEVIQFYNQKKVSSKNMKELERYTKVLSELVRQGILTQEEYSQKMEKLRNYYFSDSSKA
ncbi:hypothetical protein [Desulfitobacterium chlororespirans]|uniref:Short C-terminal domain-containing protein n=1 Tax=Desulfitobacterium chlororespirans DSM 11544 TaxID=1121395 RepID=A0A1M7T4U0_9FIRM|nr:hypothetical protein [Desulfitobacterium chlororespirans]SHN65708.1 hypothetical protein SAMN02745215_01559 [Desulfitobacterium chlororespirans DSM 11544]